MAGEEISKFYLLDRSFQLTLGSLSAAPPSADPLLDVLGPPKAEEIIGAQEIDFYSRPIPDIDIPDFIRDFITEPFNNLPQLPAVILAAQNHPQFSKGIQAASIAYQQGRVANPEQKMMECLVKCENGDAYFCGAAGVHYFAHYEESLAVAEREAELRMVSVALGVIAMTLLAEEAAMESNQ